jgi:hypothetical protein
VIDPMGSEGVSRMRKKTAIETPKRTGIRARKRFRTNRIRKSILKT